jgi:hypothetical protein
LGKGAFTGPWGKLEKFLPFYCRIITSYMKMSGMPWQQKTTKIPNILLNFKNRKKK